MGVNGAERSGGRAGEERSTATVEEVGSSILSPTLLGRELGIISGELGVRSNLRFLNGGYSGEGDGDIDGCRFLEAPLLLPLLIDWECFASLRFAAISTARPSSFANAFVVVDSKDSKRVESFSATRMRGWSVLIEA